LAGTVGSEECLIRRTSVIREALILFEGAGTTVADERVLLLFEPDLAIDYQKRMRWASRWVSSLTAELVRWPWLDLKE
jgi:hypothetical protein